MTDDAELRARIEAQVAARRADAASPDADEAPDTHADATAGASTSGRGGKGLAPTRPWQRRGAGDDAGSAPNAPVVEDDAGSASTRRGGVGPARPWAGRSSNATTAKSEPAASVEAVEDDDSAGGPLRPARPWKARPAAEAARAETGTVAPAPSHPHVVLHAIGEEDSENVPAPPPPRVRGLLQRGAGKRRSDDDRRETARADEDEQRTAARDLARRRAEAEQRLAEERAEAERKLTEERAAAERELAERRAAAERQLAEQRAEAERLHAEHRAEAERLRAEQQAEAERLRAEREEAERQLAEQRAEAERVRAEREEAERVLAERRAAMEELPETTAVYVPDAEAVSAFAEVAGPLQDHPVDEVDEDAQPTGRRPRRRRKGKDTIIAAPPAVAAASETTEDVPEPVVAAEVDAPAAERAPTAAIADEPTVDEPDESAAESYPWQQKDEVDLDLHGAPTWDPGQYPPEEDAPQQRRGRRALRWLLARAPEPAAEDVAAARSDDEALPETTAPATSEPEPLVDLPVAHLPVEDYLTRELPAVGEPAEEPAALVAEPAAVEARVDEAAAPVDAPPPEEAAGTETEFEPAAEVAAPVEEKPRAGSLFGRLRRRRHEELEEEPEEAFALPPVDESWLEPPKPTRDWAQRRAPIELGATPEEIESVVGEPTAAPEPATAIVPEPEPAPEPEPVAAIVPEPEPASEPEPATAIVPESEPAPKPEPEPVVRRRPAPGAPAAARRPSPGVAAAATTAGAQAAPAPRRRPSPGAAAAAAASAQPATSSGRSMPFELAGSAAPAATATRPKAPDLSRFLKASEADYDEDLDDGEDTGGDDGGGGGGRARSSGDGRWRRVVTRTGVTLLIAALAAVLLRVFIVQPYYIPSASMEPTLHGCPGCNDDHVLVDKISYRVHDVRVGDIVVFHKPPNAQVSEDVLIKRVIALGGDKISMKKGRVFVNGALLEESYLNKDHSCYATDPAENFGVRTVPSGDVFVMGDNRCNSEDSREFGPIKTSSVIGRAFMIVWPLNRIRFLGS